MSRPTPVPTQTVELSIVVPTFNEAGNVNRLLELLEAALAGISYEVIFVDDDSPDLTAEIARSIARTDPRVKVLRRIGRNGLASACLEGMMAANAPYIAVMDADLQHDEKILPAMLRKAQQERLDVVVGSRNVAGGGMGEFSNERVSLSNWGRRLSQFVCRTKISDPMSGFFLVDRQFLEEVIYKVSGVGFKILVDLLASSSRPVRLAEIPYTFRNRFAGESKLDVLVMVEYLQLLVDKLTGGLLPPRFFLFSLVGLTGVAVHLGVLAALQEAIGASFRTAYLSATFVAMTSNFFLNNATTYRDCRFRGFRPLFTGWFSFCLACSIGALISVQVAELMRSAHASWITASLTGVALASIWNFAMTRLFTWGMLLRSRRRRHAQHLLQMTLTMAKSA